MRTTIIIKNWKFEHKKKCHDDNVVVGVLTLIVWTITLYNVKVQVRMFES